MSAEETLTIVRDYLSGRRPENMAEDATFTDFTQPEPLRGREAIAAQFRLFYGGAFQDASAEYRNWIADEHRVVLEFTFRGVHTGPLNGRQPSGMRVETPMCVIYDVEGGLIRQARLYYDSQGMP